MRKVVNLTHCSLDGLIERMEDWHFQYLDDDMTRLFADTLRS